mgnify:CR=1 FL=1
MERKRVYTFGNGKAEGKADMRNLLGGKGANLAEMNLIGVPVPPGFTITTEVCSEYYDLGKDKVVELLKSDVEKAIANIETLMNSKFGDVANPLLVSVRSGARASMPGMMDTILNLGLNDEVVEGLSRKTNNPRFAWDSYRRFVQMYGDVVLGMKPTNKEDIDPFEAIIEEVKEAKGVKLDNELDVEDLKALVAKFKMAVKAQTGKDFPTSAYEQLWGAICAVFDSWMNERAILYRKMEGIPAEWGTAVSVQAMVFGNMGDTSATGVCFSRDAGNGEDLFNGEYLINAQGEDVVAGIRTPQQITKIGSQRWAERAGISEEDRVAKYPSMEEAMPEIYRQLDELQTKLENHYHDMQDMEFTVQEGKLWFLQTRNGKRTGAAMVKIAIDLLHQGMIDEKTALKRIEPNKLDELLHPVFDKVAEKQAKVWVKGLPASPGAATGQIVFFADDAAKWHADGKKIVMVRIETSPEDLAGMAVAEGILTARGGMTSHAAVVARGMGKCCVSGAGALEIDYKNKTVEVDGIKLKEGDYISINGTTGTVYVGKVETKAAELSGDFAELMTLADKYTKLQVRTNADTPHDATIARNFGAVGIGLCRTEHMFFEGEKIKAMREMILAEDAEGRKNALAKILPYQKEDFKGIFKAMAGCPVTVRLLDPPLHEFVPHDLKGQEEMAEAMGVSVKEIQKRVESLCEHNPMLGHRGCRLGNTYPEITEMQTRAILGAALELKKEGIEAKPEIMVPLTGILYEFKEHKKVIRYDNVLPENTIFHWDEIGHFRLDQYILMHSVLYRTEMLKLCQLKLPKHTFYVDNIYVYYPLPHVRTLYYLNVDFYRYFIGREDQSVNEKIMIGRIDQQLFVTKTMISMYELRMISSKKLRKYMVNYLAIMMTVSSILCIRSKKPENLTKKKELWSYLKRKDYKTYMKIRYGILGQTMNLPGRSGRKVSSLAYSVARRLIGFN